MTRTLLPILALASLLVVVLSAPFALALDEADRLWLVGEQASADGLSALARRALERFVADYPNDKRQPQALLLLGPAGGRARGAGGGRAGGRRPPPAASGRGRPPRNGSRRVSGRPRLSIARGASPRRARRTTT